MANNTTKKWFFGWSNIKWLITEIMNIYSNKDSYFSKKRIESGIGFIIAEWGMIYYLTKKMATMDMMEFGGWAAIQFFVGQTLKNSFVLEVIFVVTAAPFEAIISFGWMPGERTIKS